MIFSENKLVDRVSLVRLQTPAFRVSRRLPALKQAMVSLLYCVYDTRQVAIILRHPQALLRYVLPEKKKRKKIVTEF